MLCACSLKDNVTGFLSSRALLSYKSLSYKNTCSGCSPAYAIKSCNKCHWGKVVFNSKNENVGSLTNISRMIRPRALNIHKSRLNNLNLMEATNQCADLSKRRRRNFGRLSENDFK